MSLADKVIKTYSCEHVLVFLPIVAKSFFHLEVLGGLMVFNGGVLEDLMLIDCGETRPGEDWLTLTAVAIDGVYRD